MSALASTNDNNISTIIGGGKKNPVTMNNKSIRGFGSNAFGLPLVCPTIPKKKKKSDDDGYGGKGVSDQKKELAGDRADKVENIETEFNPDYVTRMIPKLDWPALVAATKEIGAGDFPEEITEDMMSDDTFLKKLHHALLEIRVRVIEGALICPESGRRFPIQNSIPNMLLNEDEV